MSVARDEFENLVSRVDRIERTLGATIEIMSAEVVGLRAYLDDRFAGFDERLDVLGAKFDLYTKQVKVAIRVGGDAAARNERFALAIADHFSIDLNDS